MDIGSGEDCLLARLEGLVLDELYAVAVIDECVSGDSAYAAGRTGEGQKEPAGVLQTGHPGDGKGLGGTEKGGRVLKSGPYADAVHSDGIFDADFLQHDNKRIYAEIRREQREYSHDNRSSSK